MFGFLKIEGKNWAVPFVVVQQNGNPCLIGTTRSHSLLTRNLGKLPVGLREFDLQNHHDILTSNGYCQYNSRGGQNLRHGLKLTHFFELANDLDNLHG